MTDKLYVNDKGMKVQVLGDAASDLIEYCSQGGGFSKRLPRDRFFAEFRPYEVPKYSPRKATFDHFDEGVSVNAWSNDLRWNGWAMPYFSYEQGLKVLGFFPELRFDKERNAFVWRDEGAEEEEVYASMTIETESGPMKAYPIGTGSWTWEWDE